GRQPTHLTRSTRETPNYARQDNQYVLCPAEPSIDSLYKSAEPGDDDDELAAGAAWLALMKEKADNKNVSLPDYIKAMFSVLDDSAVARRLEEMRRTEESFPI